MRSPAESRVDVRKRLPRDVGLILAAVFLPFFVYHSYRNVEDYRFGRDAHAYWLAWRGPMYDLPPLESDAFLYSPAFAHALWPLVQLPWAAFVVLWTTAAVLAFWHLLRPLGRWSALLLTACCCLEWVPGNILWLFALVAAYGLRWPALWAIPLLTKIAPAVGLVWFAARGEWRKLGTAIGVTAAVALASFVLAPNLWSAWLDMLINNSDASHQWLGFATIWVRWPAAVLLVAWGARTDRPWVIPPAMMLASPTTLWSTLTLLAALPRLRLQSST